MIRALAVLEGWLVGGWFGSWALFALVVAPTAFAAMGVDAAGSFVAPILRTLHLTGLAAGLGLFAIAFAIKRGPASILIPAVLAAICAVSEFGVTTAIANVKPSDYGASTPTMAAAEFQRLHLISRALFGAVLVGLAALIAVHAFERDLPVRASRHSESR